MFSRWWFSLVYYSPWEVPLSGSLGCRFFFTQRIVFDCHSVLGRLFAHRKGKSPVLVVNDYMVVKLGLRYRRAAGVTVGCCSLRPPWVLLLCCVLDHSIPLSGWFSSSPPVPNGTTYSAIPFSSVSKEVIVPSTGEIFSDIAICRNRGSYRIIFTKSLVKNSST